jgi:hypothetical protein
MAHGPVLTQSARPAEGASGTGAGIKTGSASTDDASLLEKGEFWRLANGRKPLRRGGAPAAREPPSRLTVRVRGRIGLPNRGEDPPWVGTLADRERYPAGYSVSCAAK